MGNIDWFAWATFLAGLGVTMITSLVPESHKQRMPWIFNAGYYGGFVLLGLGIYVAIASQFPASYGLGYMSKLSMVVGAVLLLGGLVWHLAASKAQVDTNSDKRLGDVDITESRPVENKDKPLFDQSIKVDSNSGTISPTYNNTVNIAPKPRLDLLGDPQISSQENGSSVVKFLVNAPVSIPRLTVQAIGPGVNAMSILREAIGGVASTSKSEIRRGTQDGMPIESFANALGRYEVTVQTKGDPRAVRLGVGVE